MKETTGWTKLVSEDNAAMDLAGMKRKM